MKLIDSKGQGLSEYLILVVLVAGVSIAAVQVLGRTVKGKVELMERHIQSDVRIESR